jgi:hypothetical protein
VEERLDFARCDREQGPCIWRRSSRRHSWHCPSPAAQMAPARAALRAEAERAAAARRPAARAVFRRIARSGNPMRSEKKRHGPTPRVAARPTATAAFVAPSSATASRCQRAWTAQLRARSSSAREMKTARAALAAPKVSVEGATRASNAWSAPSRRAAAGLPSSWAWIEELRADSRRHDDVVPGSRLLVGPR